MRTQGPASSIGILPGRGLSRRQVAFLVLVAFTASVVTVWPRFLPVPTVSGAGANERAVEGYGKLPISFEPNVGQAPGRYDFVARGQSFGMAVNATGATLALGTKKAQDLVRVNLLGANRSALPLPLQSLPGKVNYFIGDDPAKWHSDVPTFGRVSYRNVLPGIDVTYRGTNAGTLAYDFVVAADANPADIRVKFSGASDVALRDGDLVVTTTHGRVTQDAPVLYQTIAGRRIPVEGRFSLAGDQVGFEVGAYDHHRALVIDPTLAYSTYLGGTNGDTGLGIAVDGSGAAYVVGQTSSTNFPTQGALQGSNAGAFDAFVTKLNAAGSALVYSTYLGGTSADLATAVGVSGAGAAYVTGNTNSTDFPTQAPFQAANGGGEDAFVTELSATGAALSYSSYLGGSSQDAATGIAVDGAGAAYVTGYTTSTNFPTQTPFQGSYGGGADAFVTKVNPTGSALVYSTYLGGSNEDEGAGIAVDGAGAAYVTGDTWPGGALSTSFPTQAPYQGSSAGGVDAFVTKLSAAGTALVYSTYLGGSDDESGSGITVNTSGAAYVTGTTTSTDFPMQSPFQGSSAGGGGEIFVTKLNTAGAALTYSTYLGGSGADTAYGIAVGGSGAAYVTGLTFSTNFPMQSPFQASNAGSGDAFVTKFSATGAALAYSTYLGGSSADTARGIAVDTSDAAYVVGSTGSVNFPTQAPFQAANAGPLDAFVTKLAETTTPSPSPSASVSPSPTPSVSPSPTPSVSPSPSASVSPSPSASVSPSPTPSVSPSPTPSTATPVLVTGPGQGTPPLVKIFDRWPSSLEDTAKPFLKFLAYDSSFRGGVRVATGDLNGDGVPDVITGAGSGGAPRVRTFDGTNGKMLRSFTAYPNGFLGGVYVGCLRRDTRDPIPADGCPIIITGPGAGGGPRVKMFDGTTGKMLRSFLAYSSKFRGGVRVAAGDVNGDAVDDIIVGTVPDTVSEPDETSRVKVFDGNNLSVLRSFFPFGRQFTGGVYVAAGDVNGDGFADIIVGADTGGAPNVKVFDGTSGKVLQSFLAYPSKFGGGVRVAAGDVNGDGCADIITGPGKGGSPRVKTFDGTDQTLLGSFLVYSRDFLGGVNIAGPAGGPTVLNQCPPV